MPRKFSLMRKLPSTTRGLTANGPWCWSARPILGVTNYARGWCKTQINSPQPFLVSFFFFFSHLISLFACIRGRSQTKFTRFVFLWPPTPIRLHFHWYKSLQKVNFFLTTYPPPLVNVICERPLSVLKMESLRPTKFFLFISGKLVFKNSIFFLVKLTGVKDWLLEFDKIAHRKRK